MGDSPLAALGGEAARCAPLQIKSYMLFIFATNGNVEELNRYMRVKQLRSSG